MKIALLSDATQAIVAAALASYHKEAIQVGDVALVAQITSAESELLAPIQGDNLAVAAKAAGVVYTDFANNAYGEGDENPFVKAARATLSDGVDFDDLAVVSQSGRGAYVSCWHWVPNAQAGVPEISELLEELLGYLGSVEKDNPSALEASADIAELRRQRNGVEDLVVHLAEELDGLYDSEPYLPGSIVHKPYDLGSGLVDTFPSCMVKALSEVAKRVGFAAPKLVFLNQWLEENGRKLDSLVSSR
ncbi:hypothetical protein APB26_31460 [Pseudomonas aeruginosa]|uniref:hypothetical protein n=1 Tax=Pseudomonas aeruginosa TaxID=287 RepID=UPI00071BB5B8|nr:hypothetical protein [Pseudomonas aeruginosa]KSQ21508.1 hypothetical protein APB26_31460 [Pseudomonas aeruginosa]RPV61179.1 hypothetical protein IPC838_17790 [Pseudomonas aeruginosa]